MYWMLFGYVYLGSDDDVEVMEGGAFYSVPKGRMMIHATRF